MAIKSYKPTTPTLRYKKTNTYEQVTTDTPYKPLLEAKRRTNGRNNYGRITVRHRGGGHKRFYRIIDFKRKKFDIPAVVETIEYDPNRTANIALVKYLDGERRYIIATANMTVGQKILDGEKADPEEGNSIPLKNVPLGSWIHNIELREGKGGQLVKTAGGFAEVVAKEGNLVQIKLPSGEIRNFRDTLYATMGVVSNAENMNVVGGSAGRTRWLGRRPHVRGVAMNPVDHPMGGGEGKTSGGGHPVSPWGQKAKGLKTRKKRKASDKFIVRRRNKK